ncbi:hypothetical protein B0H67DRAFT_551002 [Lasiosphaeris hirsuta]|uniref:Carbohydrate-binding module family 19 domain-containing protein n=1 Tax=Lasiosphaeris hirsuta TaxID=260670 RepID=A0AA40B0I3_9PEZI|nr:hypothetical protein B0H67DRAFT_551002 [Lasiosphaeris hirsuta]
MRSAIIVISTMLLAAAEAGPLRGPAQRRGWAPKWMRDAGHNDTTTADPTTVVTVVPGQVTTDSATSSAFAVSVSPSSTSPSSPEESSTVAGTEAPSVSSFLSGSSFLAPSSTPGKESLTASTTKEEEVDPSTTAVESSAPSTASESEATASTGPSVTGPPNSEVPTGITVVPAATGTVTPDIYENNLKVAKKYNNVFSSLTKESACLSGQVACVEGNIASCDKDSSFGITICASGTECFALPMNTTSGVELKCVSKETAQGILGETPAGSSPSTLLSTSLGATTTESASEASGRFTRTATISDGTITLTFNPTVSATVTTSSELPTEPSSAPALSSAESLDSTITVTSTSTSISTTKVNPADIVPTTTDDPSSSIPLEVIPIEDSSTTSTLTITKTIFSSSSAEPTPEAPPPSSLSPSAIPSAPLTPTSEAPTTTRRRGGGGGGGGNGGDRDRPTATEDRGNFPSTTPGPKPEEGAGPEGGQPKFDGSSTDDSRVTFTLVETVTETVTEKEVVTVTVGAQ